MGPSTTSACEKKWTCSRNVPLPLRCRVWDPRCAGLLPAAKKINSQGSAKGSLKAKLAMFSSKVVPNATQDRTATSRDSSSGGTSRAEDHGTFPRSTQASNKSTLLESGAVAVGSGSVTLDLNSDAPGVCRSEINQVSFKERIALFSKVEGAGTAAMTERGQLGAAGLKDRVARFNRKESSVPPNARIKEDLCLAPIAVPISPISPISPSEADCSSQATLREKVAMFTRREPITPPALKSEAHAPTSGSMRERMDAFRRRPAAAAGASATSDGTALLYAESGDRLAAPAKRNHAAALGPHISLQQQEGDTNAGASSNYVQKSAARLALRNAVAADTDTPLDERIAAIERALEGARTADVYRYELTQAEKELLKLREEWGVRHMLADAVARPTAADLRIAIGKAAAFGIDPTDPLVLSARKKLVNDERRRRALANTSSELEPSQRFGDANEASHSPCDFVPHLGDRFGDECPVASDTASTPSPTRPPLPADGYPTPPLLHRALPAAPTDADARALLDVREGCIVAASCGTPTRREAYSMFGLQDESESALADPVSAMAQPDIQPSVLAEGQRTLAFLELAKHRPCQEEVETWIEESSRLDGLLAELQGRQIGMRAQRIWPLVQRLKAVSKDGDDDVARAMAELELLTTLARRSPLAEVAEHVARCAAVGISLQMPQVSVDGSEEPESTLKPAIEIEGDVLVRRSSPGAPNADVGTLEADVDRTSSMASPMSLLRTYFG